MMIMGLFVAKMRIIMPKSLVGTAESQLIILLLHIYYHAIFYLEGQKCKNP